MVDPSVIGFTSILVFIVILVLIFSAAGPLLTNPYGILLVLDLGVLLVGGFMILSYIKKWWPYRDSDDEDDKRYNDIILYITIGGIVVFGILFVVLLVLSLKHSREQERILYNVPTAERVPEEAPEGSPEIPSEPDVEGSEIRKEEQVSEEPEKQRPEEVSSETEERQTIERLALENQLQKEGAELSEGTETRIKARDILLSEELQKGEIKQATEEEALKEAELKERAAQEALRTLLPSVTMFGPGGSEELITRSL